MTTKRRKRNRDPRLKIAILTSRFHTQRRLAVAARMAEVRLSQIVRGALRATDEERDRLVKLLGPDIEAFFGPRQTPVADVPISSDAGPV